MYMYMYLFKRSLYSVLQGMCLVSACSVAAKGVTKDKGQRLSWKSISVMDGTEVG